MKCCLRHGAAMLALAGMCAFTPLANAQAPAESREQQKDAGPTAQDQGSSKADRETTAKVRKAIVEDDSLSVYAHNVKIITRDGKVTLRGAVRSTEEKSAVAAIAEAVVGDAVDNQLKVKPESK